MSAYACFLAPTAGIMFSDYWIVKGRRYDVPALYDPKGIYSYWRGINWRALVVTVVVVGPLIPGMANKIASSVHIGTGLEPLFSFNWLYGFVLSITMYVSLNWALPDKRTSIPVVIHGVCVDTGDERQSSHGDAKIIKETTGVQEVGVDI